MVQIFIRTNRTTTLDVELDETVESVKSRILDREAIPLDKMRIVFLGKQLEDGRTLADCNVVRESTLHVLIRALCGNPISITVKTSSDSFELMVNLSNSVGSVKTEVQAKVQAKALSPLPPVKQMSLFYQDKELENDQKTLAECKVVDSSILFLDILNDDDPFRIVVKIASGCDLYSIIPLDVKPSDAIADVKAKIHEKKGFKPILQHLVYNGKKLDQSYSRLFANSIHKDSILYLLIDDDRKSTKKNVLWLNANFLLSLVAQFLTLKDTVSLLCALGKNGPFRGRKYALSATFVPTFDLLSDIVRRAATGNVRLDSKLLSWCYTQAGLRNQCYETPTKLPISKNYSPKPKKEGCGEAALRRKVEAVRKKALAEAAKATQEKSKKVLFAFFGKQPTAAVAPHLAASDNIPSQEEQRLNDFNAQGGVAGVTALSFAAGGNFAAGLSAPLPPRKAEEENMNMAMVPSLKLLNSVTHDKMLSLADLRMLHFLCAAVPRDVAFCSVGSLALAPQGSNTGKAYKPKIDLSAFAAVQRGEVGPVVLTASNERMAVEVRTRGKRCELHDCDNVVLRTCPACEQICSACTGKQHATSCDACMNDVCPSCIVPDEDMDNDEDRTLCTSCAFQCFACFAAVPNANRFACSAGAACLTPNRPCNFCVFELDALDTEWCENCGETWCIGCVEFPVCSFCDHTSCQDCTPTVRCSECNLQFHRDDNLLCAYESGGLFCDECNTFKCVDCSNLLTCEFCDESFCPACRPNVQCPQQGHVTCSSCVAEADKSCRAKESEWGGIIDTKCHTCFLEAFAELKGFESKEEMERGERRAKAAATKALQDSKLASTEVQFWHLGGSSHPDTTAFDTTSTIWSTPSAPCALLRLKAEDLASLRLVEISVSSSSQFVNGVQCYAEADSSTAQQTARVASLLAIKEKMSTMRAAAAAAAKAVVPACSGSFGPSAGGAKSNSVTIPISPPAVSRYNDAYYCSVDAVTFTRTGIEVSFEVVGDGSLGELQNPLDSRLFVGGSQKEEEAKRSRFSNPSTAMYVINNSSSSSSSNSNSNSNSSNSSSKITFGDLLASAKKQTRSPLNVEPTVEYAHNDASRVRIGKLTYPIPLPQAGEDMWGSYSFEFGSGGYSQESLFRLDAESAAGYGLGALLCSDELAAAREQNETVVASDGIPDCLTIPSHEHALVLTPTVYDNHYRCDLCNKAGIGWAYSCTECGYDCHPFCVRYLVPAARVTPHDKVQIASPMVAGHHDQPTRSSLTLAAGERIVSISVRHGAVVDSLRLRTSVSREVVFGGAGGDNITNWQVPSGWRLVGFFGGVGGHLHNLGVVIARGEGQADTRGFGLGLSDGVLVGVPKSDLQKLADSIGQG